MCRETAGRSDARASTWYPALAFPSRGPRLRLADGGFPAGVSLCHPRAWGRRRDLAGCGKGPGWLRAALSWKLALLGRRWSWRWQVWWQRCLGRCRSLHLYIELGSVPRDTRLRSWNETKPSWRVINGLKSQLCHQSLKARLEDRPGSHPAMQSHLSPQVRGSGAWLEHVDVLRESCCARQDGERSCLKGGTPFVFR